MVLEVMSAIARDAFPGAVVKPFCGIAEAESAARASDTLDMVLLDLGIPGCSGIDALTRFREIVPAVPIVVVSAFEERAVMLAALLAGAKAYIPKTYRPDVISAVLRLVAAGGVYVPPEAIDGQPAPAQPTAAALTDRQTDVLRLLARGLGNKEIARRLRIATETVKHHLKPIFAALGITSRVQAALAAARLGIKLD